MFVVSVLLTINTSDFATLGSLAHAHAKAYENIMVLGLLKRIKRCSSTISIIDARPLTAIAISLLLTGYEMFVLATTIGMLVLRIKLRARLRSPNQSNPSLFNITSANTPSAGVTLPTSNASRPALLM